jgi:hypothetical protein
VGSSPRRRLDEYDTWSLRWLARWIDEAPEPTIGKAADIAGWLADLPTEPSSLEAIRATLDRSSKMLAER